jgi:hypothetical protein
MVDVDAGEDPFMTDRGDEIESLNWALLVLRVSPSSSIGSEKGGLEDIATFRFWRFDGGAIAAGGNFHSPSSVEEL